jgi:hypothetical protein
MSLRARRLLSDCLAFLLVGLLLIAVELGVGSLALRAFFAEQNQQIAQALRLEGAPHHGLRSDLPREYWNLFTVPTTKQQGK